MWPGDGVDRLDLAAVARAGPGIEDHRAPSAAQPAEQVAPVDDPRPMIGEVQLGGLELGLVGRRRQAQRQPRRQATVEDRGPRVAEVVQHPPQSGRHPAADVVVDRDQVAIADPGPAEAGGERERIGQRMAAGALGGRQVAVDVEVNRVGQVTCVIGGASRTGLAQVPADVDDPQVGIVDPGGKLLGADQAHAPSMAAPGGPAHAQNRSEPVLSFGRRGPAPAGPSTAAGGPRSGVAQW